MRKIASCWGVKQLQMALLRDFGYFPPDGVFSSLGQTVKTHKPAGAVTMRALHSSTGSPLKPIYRFVAEVFRDGMADLKHLVVSSNDFCKKIARHSFGATDMLWGVYI